MVCLFTPKPKYPKGPRCEGMANHGRQRCSFAGKSMVGGKWVCFHHAKEKQ